MCTFEFEKCCTEVGRGGGGNVAEILRERPNSLVGRFSGGRNEWN